MTDRAIDTALRGLPELAARVFLVSRAPQAAAAREAISLGPSGGLPRLQAVAGVVWDEVPDLPEPTDTGTWDGVAGWLSTTYPRWASVMDQDTLGPACEEILAIQRLLLRCMPAEVRTQRLRCPEPGCDAPLLARTGDDGTHVDDACADGHQVDRDWLASRVHDEMGLTVAAAAAELGVPPRRLRRLVAEAGLRQLNRGRPAQYRRGALRALVSGDEGGVAPGRRDV